MNIKESNYNQLEILVVMELIVFLFIVDIVFHYIIIMNLRRKECKMVKHMLVKPLLQQEKAI